MSTSASINTDIQENRLKLEVEEDILIAPKKYLSYMLQERPPVPCWNYLWFFDASYFAIMKNKSGLSKTCAAQTMLYDVWLLF